MANSFDPDEFTWIVVFGAFAAFMAAFGIGANDVANAFATSVGSGALTVKQATVVAFLFEFIGACFFGTEVTKTIRKKIVEVDCFEEDPPILMYGCFCVATSVAFWLILASKLEVPVSTTHSCIGGMMGIGLVMGKDGLAKRVADAKDSKSCVVWFKEGTVDLDANKIGLPGGFTGVVLGWIFSPVLSGILACLIFFLIRTFVLRHQNAFQRSVVVFPILWFVCVFILTAFMMFKGMKGITDIKAMETGTKFGVSAAFGAGFAVLWIPISVYFKKGIEDGKFATTYLSIEARRDAASGNSKKGSDLEVASAPPSPPPSPPADGKAEVKSGNFFSKLGKSLMYGQNVDIHESIERDGYVTGIHDNAEKFDRKAEAYFTILQIFSAAFDALAHGANDVANAMGPFATIYLTHKQGKVSSKSDMGDDKYWILGVMGGFGIGVGLIVYGYQILRAIGVKLAVITPSRGFSIEMGSSIVVILGSLFGLPLSTTHCQVGATTGVALLEGCRGVNVFVLGKTLFGMLCTCVIVGFISATIFAFGVYTPTKSTPMVHQCTTGFFEGYAPPASS